MMRRVWVLAAAFAALAGPTRGGELVVAVEAGPLDRDGTPVRLPVPLTRLGAGVVDALRSGPVGVRLRESPGGESIVGQLDRWGSDDSQAGLTFVPAGKSAAGTARRFAFDPTEAMTDRKRWAVATGAEGNVSLSHSGKPVYRYNRAEVADPRFPEVQSRNAYIHPAYSPSGALLTGDFSTFHTHHRGIFLAYTKTEVAGKHPDFWNFHTGSGKIHADGVDLAAAGPVTARLVVRHRWEAAGLGVVLRERWEVEAYDVPGTPFWMFDLTSTQQAADAPLKLPAYRYGGMAYRGPEPFVKGVLDVRTSEGLGRQSGDQKPARWVDLTGPVAEGSDRYGGALVLDHPENPHHPTPARIHPTTLPFLAFTPSHDKALTIPADRPTVFRYRFVLHDGRPDPALDERLWQDFARPPAARLLGESR